MTEAYVGDCVGNDLPACGGRLCGPPVWAARGLEESSAVRERREQEVSKRIQLEVHPGVCGFVASIEARSEDEQHVVFQIESACENIRALAARLHEVDSFKEIGDGFGGQVHQAVRASLKGCCSGCVVPSGVFKAMQVVAGLALPADSRIAFSLPE